MNEQQLAAVKQALEALKECRCDPRLKYEHPFYDKVITDLEQVIAQDALDWMAKNARELGLSYDDAPKIGCVNHDCDKCKAVQEPIYQMQMMDGKWIDQAKQSYEYNKAHGHTVRILYATPPAAQPAPVAQSLKDAVFTVIEGFNIPHDVRKILESAYYNAPPAPQPVSVKTYHDGKPWPVAPKPWVGLTDEEIKRGWKESWVDKQAFEAAVWWAEKKLKEKNT